VQVAEYVSKKAYLRWLDRGGHHGNDFDDWLEAEQRMPVSALLGWKPFRIRDGQDIQREHTPGLVNWKEFLCGHRRCVKDTPCVKIYQSIAWINEYDAMHSNGHPPIPRERLALEMGSLYTTELLAEPFPFPDPQELLDRNAYVEFHGIVLMMWVVRLIHGKVEWVEFEFQRHPDSICHEVSRSDVKGRHLLTNRVYDFPRSQSWENSCFDFGPYR
jgi:hypothetical protein